MAKILITGGSGFIGSQTVKTLSQQGHKIYVVDWDAKTWALKDNVPADNIYVTDFASQDFLEFIFKIVKPHAVIHLAALHQVNDSMSMPDAFYHNNVVKTHALLHQLRESLIPIIFSGTASVYGNPVQPTAYFTEEDPTNPCNVYARTKLAIEWMLEDFHNAYGLNSMILRYFNAAGADPGGKLGYVQQPASHVVPILMNKINEGEIFNIYGNDYPTVDGTCVRDYTHVQDLADAHSAALNYLLDQKGDVFEKVNIGSGKGTSVTELVTETSRVLGKQPHIVLQEPRLGDPACLVADITKAKNLLGWTPKLGLDDIIQHAWKWELTKDQVTEDR